MAVRVLVVDDSRFFRRRVIEMLESDSQIKVIDSAENGLDAVSKASRLKPDVITMDVEMPVMDGITATRKIMAVNPTAILMFSSLTTEGAKSTLDALEAGAVDFLPKRFEDISNDRDEARRLYVSECVQLAHIGVLFHVLDRPVARARWAQKNLWGPLQKKLRWGLAQHVAHGVKVYKKGRRNSLQLERLRVVLLHYKMC